MSTGPDHEPPTRPGLADDLLPVLYDQLRRLAAARLAHEAPGATLTPTALVHEAYLRLVGLDPSQPWDGRGHFFAAAAEAMRRILIDRARARLALKRGGDLQRVDHPLTGIASPVDDDAQLLALDDALHHLEAKHPRKAALVRLRYFAGLTLVQAADALSISPATADRDWSYARAWLRLHLDRSLS